MKRPRQLNTTATLDLEWSLQEYIAARPWERLKDHHIFCLPHSYRAHDDYAVAMGDAGEFFGVTLHTGPEAEQDVLALITGNRHVFATRLAAMATTADASADDAPPQMICKRMDPADSTLDLIAQALFRPMAPLTTPERRDLDNALRAATDIVSNPAHPPDLVSRVKHSCRSGVN